jgi:hypothetical protein
MTAPASAGPLERLPFPLQEAEQVLALCRRHWWFLWPRTILLALIALAPVVVAFWLLEEIGARDDLGIIFWIAVALWLAYWGARAFFNWYQYRNDIWVVTNQRLIDSYKANPFSLRISTADLVNLQDMSVVKSGIVPTMLNFGNVVCETAGSERAAFTIAGIPRPEAIQLFIDRERDRERMRRE